MEQGGRSTGYVEAGGERAWPALYSLAHLGTGRRASTGGEGVGREVPSIQGRPDVREDGIRTEIYAVLMLRPLKKAGGQVQPKIPQYIVQYDGGGSDAYEALRRLERFDPVPAAERGSTPLFRQFSGPRATHMTVNKMRMLVRLRMQQLGYEEPKQWGAHSCRIGGATDLVATGKASAVLLQAKGRWASDIGKIYARMTRRCQLAASELMQAARGRDLEELLPEFVQPAT